MPTNVQIPALGESVTEAVLLRWHKQDGETVAQDEPICELETDKANVDLPSPASGVLTRAKQEGAKVRIGETIATIDPNGSPRANAKAPAKSSVAAAAGSGSSNRSSSDASATTESLSPAVRRLVEENNLDPSSIKATGPGDRITKEDVLKHLESQQKKADGKSQESRPATDAEPAEAATIVTPAVQGADGPIRRVPMSKIRKKIAERLVQAQHTAAILTTFNEVDLSNVMSIRAKYKETFEKKHNVGLGFMSFFAKSVVLALREFEKVNAMIESDDIVYHDYVHLGIAVSTDRGLAVPVLRNAHQMSFAKIESEIKRLAAATRDGKLSLQELSGGTFTITNGGVFGSLMATPIINPPQSAILGMHKIQERPVAIAGKVEIRPMMYVALSYDHRLIDGRESVSFLVRVKELLEDPARLMLEV
ncbi:MAG: 2-oxoglutarate dehydrogenase complex dihydrolipoyllysine-residue succinyltransferase [Anaerolineae bacterium]|nr:2-oxoglutarate dehydrogenase complex dihydrolipoyllysine-residue succinyltransferase [Phycisphaerae bacterium]